MSGPIVDWTKGIEAIVYQTCNGCGARQYFRRSFCAACGSPDLAEHRASGAGDGVCDLAGLPRRDA
ncbi:putative OB-fold protein [Bradyrhizobium elkanii]